MIEAIFNNIVGGVKEYRSSSRPCSTRWKVAGSISDAVEFFSLPNPASSTVAVEFVQPLTEINTMSFPVG
jgi:hypothetical protein